MKKYFGIITLLFVISSNKVNCQKIAIFENTGEIIEGIEEYPLHEIVLSIPSDIKYKYVKIKSIEKVINEKNENLVYERDSINRIIPSFPSREFVQIDNTDAKLNFWIKTSENKNIKLIKGVLSYLINSDKAEVSFNLNTDSDKNLVSEQCPVKIFRVDESVAAKYHKKGQEKEAKTSDRPLDIVEKDDKLMTEIFGSQIVEFTTNQIVFWIEGSTANLIAIKFFDKSNNEINLSEDQDNAIVAQRGLYAFYFDQKPQNDWKIKIYYSNKNTLVEIPFETNSEY